MSDFSEHEAAEAGDPRGDSPAAAAGRRALSTAYVRIGPDGRLSVQRHDGKQLVLRDVVMRADDYCGIFVSGGKAGARYCAPYAEVATARPGGGAQPAMDDHAADRAIARPGKRR